MEALARDEAPYLDYKVLTTDPRSRLILNGYLGRSRVISLVQPTSWFDDDIDVAARTLECLHETLSNLTRVVDLTAGDRIRRAIASANADLLALGQATAGQDFAARTGVGAALVLVEEGIATIGIVPPAQLLLWQDGRLTWCPTRESWTGRHDGLSGSPLGWTQEPQPTVVATAVNQRDELVLTTDAVARELATFPAATLRTSAAVCDHITALSIASSADDGSLMAVSTRFVAPTASGSVLGSTRHALTQVEDRVKSAWIALRSQP